LNADKEQMDVDCGVRKQMEGGFNRWVLYKYKERGTDACWGRNQIGKS
jgi:hypothetical protein